MKEAQVRRLLRRFAPSGYDHASETYRPWYRIAAYRVEIRSDRGSSHTWMGRIVLTNDDATCAHGFVHAFHHEAAHCQLLPLDIAVLCGIVLPSMSGSFWAILAGVVAWNFVWREVAADSFVTIRLGCRATWKGYWHRRARASERRAP